MALVSHEYRFIFLKTFKTASTSVEGYLERYCVPEGTPVGDLNRPAIISERGIVGVRGSDSYREGDVWTGHMTAREVRDALDPAIWSSYAKIITIRNVYARLVSHFGKRNKIGRNADRAAVHRFFKRWLFERDHSLYDIPRYSIDGVNIVDEAVRYEHLHDDLAALCSRLGLPAYDPALLPHLRNKPRRREKLGDPKEYYDADCLSFVAENFAWEIERFGYRLEDATLSVGEES
jgi:hypothetical protein